MLAPFSVRSFGNVVCGPRLITETRSAFRISSLVDWVILFVDFKLRDLILFVYLIWLIASDATSGILCLLWFHVDTLMFYN